MSKPCSNCRPDRKCVECQKKDKARLRNALRRDRDAAYRDLGMVRVRGNLGGTFYE